MRGNGVLRVGGGSEWWDGGVRYVWVGGEWIVFAAVGRLWRETCLRHGKESTPAFALGPPRTVNQSRGWAIEAGAPAHPTAAPRVQKRRGNNYRSGHRSSLRIYFFRLQWYLRKK